MSQFYSYPSRCLYGGREVPRPRPPNRFPEDDPEEDREERFARVEPIPMPPPDIVEEFYTGIRELNDLDNNLQGAFTENADIDGNERDEIITYLNETEEALSVVVSAYEVFNEDSRPAFALIRRLRQQLTDYNNVYY